MVIAWDLEQRTKCPCGCGQPVTKSMAKSSQFAYEAVMIRCHARAAMERASIATQRDMKDMPPDKVAYAMAGMLTQLVNGPDGPL